MEKTQSEYSVVKQQKRDLYAKMYIMDFNFNILDEISGVVLTCSFTNNANSQLRRSCSISISPTDSSFDISYGNKLWLDKYIKIETGIKDIHTGDVAYTNRGIYLINNPSRVYSAINNTIDIQGLDLMSKLTGERNGNLKGMTYIIPANTFSYSAIVAILAEGGFTQYALDYWNCPYTPNEISIDIGGTLYDLLNAILEIDSMMQMYFDVNGVFHYEKIPITAEEQIIIDDDIWTDVLIDYKQDTNYDEVKNSIEVFGKTHDITNYDATATMTEVSGARTINVTLSGVTDYPSGLMFGVIFTSATIPQRQITYLEINSASPLILNNNRVYDADDMYFEQNIIYVFRIASGSFDDILHPCIQYMGGLQPYAKIEETNSTSPFYVDGTMGTVRKVLNNGEYDNISTDLMARERANWELYQRCRVQDSIIIKCVPIYWADVNTVIEITPPNKNGTEETNRYMIKSISDSYGVDEIQTINAMKYFPYYTDYEPDMEGVYDMVNLFVPVKQGEVEDITFSMSLKSYGSLNWGDGFDLPTTIVSDFEYNRTFNYETLPEDLHYLENGADYKGVWIKIKIPKNDLNHIKFPNLNQNITKLYANVNSLGNSDIPTKLKELKLIGNITTSLRENKSLESIYIDGNNTQGILSFSECTNLKEVELVNVSDITDMSYMFYFCESLERVVSIDALNVDNMSGMFYNCTSLTTTTLLNTSSVENMTYMFSGCSSLIILPLLDTSNVINMQHMFNNCSSLKLISLLNTSSVESMNGMFSGCTSLTTIENLNFKKISNMSNLINLFTFCSSLKKVKITNATVLTTSTELKNLFYDKVILENLSVSGLSNIINMADCFIDFTSLKEVELLDTLNVTNMTRMFYSCSSLTTITLPDTSNVITTQEMFSNCSSLKSILSLNTSNVVDMRFMFINCTSLKSIPLLNTSSVENMTYMFSGCSSLIILPLLDTSNVINMQHMFNNCSSLITIPLLNTSNVTNTMGMFSDCTSLTSIPLLDTSSVKNMFYMLYNCNLLTTIPLLDTSSVTNMSSMFSNCISLTTIPLLDTSSVTSMSNMFYDCSSLKSIPLLDTSNVEDVLSMFVNCILIETISLADLTNVTRVTYMVSNCLQLSTLSLQNLYQDDLKLPNPNELSSSALNSLFTSLGDCSAIPKTLTITGSLGASTCDTTIATAKGWVVVN